MPTRRTFLLNSISTFGLLAFAGCVRTGGENIEEPESRSIEGAAAEKRVDLQLHAQVPRLMLFPHYKLSTAQGSNEKDIRIVAMELGDLSETDYTNMNIKLLFSNGDNRSFKGNAMSHYRGRANGSEAIQREGVLLKNIISSILDSLFITVKKWKSVDSLNMIKRDFFYLQEEAILRSAPIGAVYRLAGDINHRATLRRVEFDRQQLLFRVV